MIKFYFDNVAKETPYEQIVEFLDTYGSYLDLNSALMTIGRVGKVMGNIIPLLLKIAKYDPLHLQSAKDHTYNGKVSESLLMFYLILVVSSPSFIFSQYFRV